MLLNICVHGDWRIRLEIRIFVLLQGIIEMNNENAEQEKTNCQRNQLSFQSQTEVKVWKLVPEKQTVIAKSPPHKCKTFSS